MDIVRALRELHQEKKRLDAAIASLEARLKAGRITTGGKPAKGRRGRKSMSAEERLEVSKRMTQYWEARRAKASSQQSQNSRESASPGDDHQPNSTSAL
jgi:hypothetical protein